jgi:hypothetical protein
VQLRNLLSAALAIAMVLVAFTVGATINNHAAGTTTIRTITSTTMLPGSNITRTITYTTTLPGSNITRTITSTTTLPGSNASGAVTEEALTEVFITNDFCIDITSTSFETLYLVGGTLAATTTSGSTTTTLTFSQTNTSTFYDNETFTVQGPNGVSITCTWINAHYNVTQSENSACPNTCV